MDIDLKEAELTEGEARPAMATNAARMAFFTALGGGQPPVVTRHEDEDGRVFTRMEAARARPIPPQQMWIAPRRWSHQRARGTSRRPGARRRSGASSRSSGSDPGEPGEGAGDGPPPAARLKPPIARKPARYTFGFGEVLR